MYWALFKRKCQTQNISLFETFCSLIVTFLNVWAYIWIVRNSSKQPLKNLLSISALLAFDSNTGDIEEAVRSSYRLLTYKTDADTPSVLLPHLVPPLWNRWDIQTIPCLWPDPVLQPASSELDSEMPAFVLLASPLPPTGTISKERKKERTEKHDEIMWIFLSQ